VEWIAPGIRQIDTLLGGMDRMTAGFLVEGAQPALVETGSQSSVAAVRAALTDAGLGPQDLRWIIVTHIHLDHAGGVGDMATAFPRATVVVHERGARHLVDPTRLIDSAARVYGPLLDGLYGRAGAETIRVNCAAKVILHGLDYAGAAEVKLVIGDEGDDRPYLIVLRTGLRKARHAGHVDAVLHPGQDIGVGQLHAIAARLARVLQKFEQATVAAAEVKHLGTRLDPAGDGLEIMACHHATLSI